MSGTHPIDVLDHEHRVIEKVIAEMRTAAEKLASGRPVDGGRLRGFAPFLRGFADACHHGKEEHRLFPLLLEKGLPAQGGPVQVMVAEHEHARILIAEMAELAQTFSPDSPTDRRVLAHVLTQIADHYTQHIWKEDHVLFPMARRLLDKDDVARLETEFAAVETEHGAHQRFHDFARGLAA